MISQSGEHLGSHFEISLPEEHAALFPVCFAELVRIEAEFSRFKETSKLSVANKQLGAWQKVSDEFFFLIKTGVDFNKVSGGSFDLTVKADLDRLGYDKDYSFTKKETPLRKKIAEPIKLGPDNTIFLQAEIEFGGFGKGYCLDRLSKILEEHKVSEYYINGGGDIYAKKKKGWTILLEHPDNPEMAIGQVSLNGAIACSAPNRRKWGEFHHLLNAKTRMPEKSVKAIFVTARTGIEADGYATALFSAGFAGAIELVKKLPVEMLIISSENKMFKTDGFQVDFFS